MSLPLLYRDKPIFGLDIGRSTIKVVQVTNDRHDTTIQGYGFAHFDRSATADGVLVETDVIAQTIHNLFKDSIVGKISTDRAVASIPIAHIYTRVLQLPKMKAADLSEAVKLEAEQYVPLAADDIYIEHQVIPNGLPPAAKGPANDLQAVLMVATPKKILASYLELFTSLGLDVQTIEPNMFANFRSINFNCPTAGPKIIIDFGAQSSDLAIYDQHPQLVSTISTGGDQITSTISKALKLSHEQAHQLKIKYGIAKSRWQGKLAQALEPILSDFANEVQKLLRYYHEHKPSGDPIKQINIVGGGANMPGLAEFLSHLTGVKVDICDPWAKLKIEPLQPPVGTETTIYATAMGLALWRPSDD